LIASLAFAASSVAPLCAQNTIGTVDVNPKSMPVNVATAIVVTAVITSPALLPDGAQLQRIDSAGRVVATYGVMRDNGQNGDAVANDKVFSLRITLAEGAPGPVNLRVAAAFQGLLTRVFSGLVTVNVTGAPAPKIAITAPANLAYLNVSPTTVSGTVDIAGATVKVNEIAAPLNAGRFSVAVPLAEGPNILTVTATAPGAPISTESVTVNLDTTPPRVTIVSPTEGFATTESSIAVSGIVNDIVVGTVNPQQVTVTVNGRQTQVSNRSFLAAGVPLNTGENTITAVARDRAGNSFTTSIKIRRDPPPPATAAVLRIVSGDGQTGQIGAPAARPLVVSLLQGSTPLAGKKVIFKVLQNNALVGQPAAASFVATTNAQGQASVPLTLGERSGAGGNLIEAYAVGYEGTARFAATGVSSSAALIVVDSGSAQLGAVNQRLPKPFIAVVTDKGYNRLAGIPVTFTVKAGGGNFGGTGSVTVTTDSDGRAAAALTLGFQEGRENNLVEANYPLNQGYPAVFTASGRLVGDPAKTRISGVVLDNSNQPLPGVTVRAVLTNALTMNSSSVGAAATVATNAQGQFAIEPAPVGFVKLLIDGSTAAKPGKYPSLDYDLVTVAGQTNTVGQPIYLLPIKEDNKLCVSPTAGGGTLTIPEAPGFSLTFGPGQVTFPGGSKEGCVSVTVVHSDKVPMVPGFGQQPRFIVTIQPAGAVFNPPAPITIPNVDGLKPNAMTEMYSFDHDIGSFVAIGTGQVSEDGLVIRSSAGVGVLKAGWHCGGNANPTGTAAECGPCAYCDQAERRCKPKQEQTGKPCANPCVSDGFGNCGLDGYCSGTKRPDCTPCGGGNFCVNGHCTGSGVCDGPSPDPPPQCDPTCQQPDPDPCVMKACVDGTCQRATDPRCVDRCEGRTSGSCSAGSLSGKCDESGYCQLCDGTNNGEACLHGVCTGPGQCDGEGDHCPPTCGGGSCRNGKCIPSVILTWRNRSSPVQIVIRQGSATYLSSIVTANPSVDGGSFLWLSTNEEVLAVSGTGRTATIVGKAPGTSTLFVSYSLGGVAVGASVLVRVIYPVLFVHGIDSSSSTWSQVFLGLSNHDLIRTSDNCAATTSQLDYCAMSFDVAPSLAPWGNQSSFLSEGELVATAIDRIVTGTGAEKVVIIAHSMGGLASRAAIQLRGRSAKVAALITLGTPHLGSPFANVLEYLDPASILGVGAPLVGGYMLSLKANSPGVADLKVGSNALSQINGDVTALLTIRNVSIIGIASNPIHLAEATVLQAYYAAVLTAKCIIPTDAGCAALTVLSSQVMDALYAGDLIVSGTSQRLLSVESTLASVIAERQVIAWHVEETTLVSLILGEIGLP